MIRKLERNVLIILVTACIMMSACVLLSEQAYAATTPSKAQLPDMIYLGKIGNDIYFDYISLPKNAKTLEIWIRRAAYRKYVCTVKKGTSKYRKYYRSKSYVLKKKSGKTYKVYKKIKAAKWVKIIDTKKIEYLFDWKTYNGKTYKIRESKRYQIRVRGRNGKKHGKYSNIIKFKAHSENTLDKYYEMYEDEGEILDASISDLKAQISETTDPGMLDILAADLEETEEKLKYLGKDPRGKYWRIIYDSGNIPNED